MDDLENRFNELRQEILETDDSYTWENEKKKRILWAEIDEMDEIISSRKDDLPQEFVKRFQNEYPTLCKKLTLPRPIKKLNILLLIMGIIRFIGVIFSTILMTPIFVIFLPFRWMHPLLRRLGFKNNKLPYDYVQIMWAKWTLYILGIEVEIEGWENVKKIYEEGTSTIGLFQHSSYTDFIIVMASCGIVFKWIGKKSAFWIPILGQLAHLAGMIPIDRKNRESAKKSLDHASHVVEKYKRSISISPEGTRSITGNLAKFKKGAFHLCLRCKSPVTPIVIFGAYQCWPPKQPVPLGGRVVLRFHKPISVTPYLPDKYQSLLEDSRKIMMKSMANPPRYNPEVSLFFKLKSTTVIIMTYFLMFYLINLLFI